MMQQRFWVLCCAIGLCMTLGSHTVHAQEQTSGSGTVLPAPATDTGALLRARAALLLTQHAPAEHIAQSITDSLSARNAWLTQRERVATRRQEHRVECRANMRRANRDQLAGVAADCYRADLAQDQYLLELQFHALSTPFGGDEAPIAALKDAYLRLIDAEQTIMDAIDAGVFVHLDQLSTAKRNLDMQYRLPWRIGVARLHAFRLRSIALSYVRTLLDRYALSPTDEERESLNAALSCTMDAAEKLTVAEQSFSWDAARDELTEYNLYVFDCIKLLKKMPKNPSDSSEETRNP